MVRVQSRAEVGAAEESRATKMPLIVVANSPDKAAALAGLERWKTKYAEAAAHLAVDDVLVDSMRGRSSTWTRIRINLRHVPEEMRPQQETPDPDDDPTREWRERGKKQASRQKERIRSNARDSSACRENLPRVSCGRNNFQLVVSAIGRLFVGTPSAELRGMAEAVALHVVVGDFDHQFRPQRLPR